MTFSRLGRFPLGYMVVSKGLLAATGFLGSLILWRAYRRVLRRGWPIGRLVAFAVIASYLLALGWTAIDNLADVPITAALLHRDARIEGIGGGFGGPGFKSFPPPARGGVFFR